MADTEAEAEVLDYEANVEGQAQGERDAPSQEAPQHQEEPAADHGSDSVDPMSLPPHGTEVFISKIPREATDEQLTAFCESTGQKVHSIRLAKEPGNPEQNKGYAFVVFMDKEGTNDVLTKINQTDLPAFPGKKISIVRSEVKNKLFVGNMPRTMAPEVVKEKINAEVVGVITINLMTDRVGEGLQNRGFGFIEFYNHAAAELARRKLSHQGFRLDPGHDLTLSVSWAEPKRNESAIEAVKSIYVGNLPESTDESKLRAVFSAYGKISNVVMLKDPGDPSKMRNYCFVHFEERSAALKAVDESHGEAGPKPEIDGKEVIVNLARPAPARDDGPRGPYGAPYGGGARGGYGGGYGSGAPGRGGYNSGPRDVYPRSGAGAGGGYEREREREPARGGGGGYGDRGGGYGDRGGGGDRGGYARGGGGGSAARHPDRYVEPRDGGHERDGGGGGGYDDAYGGGYGDVAGLAAYGGIGGFSAGGMAGMSMVPMVMPGGQIAYVLAAPGSGLELPQQPPQPPPPRGEPPARGRAPADGYGGGGRAAGGDVGGYGRGAVDERGAAYGGERGGGPPARGAAYGAPRDVAPRDGGEGGYGRDGRGGGRDAPSRDGDGYGPPRGREPPARDGGDGYGPRTGGDGYGPRTGGGGDGYGPPRGGGSGGSDGYGPRGGSGGDGYGPPRNSGGDRGGGGGGDGYGPRTGASGDGYGPPRGGAGGAARDGGGSGARDGGSGGARDGGGGGARDAYAQRSRYAPY
ncbi:hypothetical protein FOA52_014400 [Chlamydomonas sp. UWO 241]|nr:hypothetical protein FOA52_014400 [Chlamydomonas sp. UWO 241]